MKPQWQFTFESHENGYAQSYKHRFGGWWVGVNCINNEQESLWWSNEIKKWVTYDKIGDKGGSNHCQIGTGLRAFKRHLRNHPELQGYEVYYASRLRNNDIKAVFD